MLEFVKYELEPPKYDVEECMQRDMTYAAPLKVTLRLIVFEVDEVTGARSVKDIKEQDVYMGDMPLMTDNGTFVVNGTERVIVSQMHRSPGVFFDHDRGKTHSSRASCCSPAAIIPYRGSWLDFEFDAKDHRLRPHRPPPQAAGDDAALCPGHGPGSDHGCLLRHRLPTSSKERLGDGASFPERIRGTKPTYDLVDAATGEVIAEAGKKVTPRTVKELIDSGNVKEIVVPFDAIVGRYAAKDIINETTGEIWVEAGDELTLENDKERQCHRRHAEKTARQRRQRHPDARHR